MNLLITDIGRLYGVNPEGCLVRCGAEMSEFPCVENAWLRVVDGKIAEWGAAPVPPSSLSLPAGEVLSLRGGWLFPSFCDSHTHLVYAGSREGEFVDKIRGLSYEEIARRGGGILNSADRLHEATEDELYAEAMQRVHEVMLKGTGAIEIKSGYGLNTEDELKMLRVVRRIRETSPLVVRSTFLGAHAVGRAYQGRQADYVDMLIRETIPEVGRQGLADFIDVFCDRGFFTPEETGRLLEAGARWGLRPKIHGQELADSGGVEVAVQHDALSVDHLESMTDRDISLLQEHLASRSAKDAGWLIPTALPGTSFFLGIPFAPGRRIIDAGLPLAIASDYNPGSTPSGDMKFCVSLACIKMRLLPAEALNAATLNSAAAMGVSDEVGSIAVGRRANFFVTEPLSSLDFLPYAYTTPLVRRVFLDGLEVN